jgi:hypothetical protein
MTCQSLKPNLKQCEIAHAKDKQIIGAVPHLILGVYGADQLIGFNITYQSSAIKPVLQAIQREYDYPSTPMPESEAWLISTSNTILTVRSSKQFVELQFLNRTMMEAVFPEP